MTMIKTKAVSSARHAANVAAYLDDPRAVMRDAVNIAHPERWAAEMEATRRAYGHDEPSRAGAKNTVMYHQVIAWNPDECDMHGGVMTAERCMQWAREWCAREYPDQEVAIALHRERAVNDGTERWAAHLAVNRTDLATGLRYDPGLGHVAAAHRAKAARQLDAEWGLAPTHRGRTSRVHERQAPQPVREMRARGARPWRDDLATIVRQAASQAVSVDDLASRLAAQGVTLRVRGKRDVSYQLAGHNPVRGSRLADGTDRQTVAAQLAANARAAKLRDAVERLADAAARYESYLAAVEDARDAVPPEAEVAEARRIVYAVGDAERAADSARGVGGRVRASGELRRARAEADRHGGVQALRARIDAADAARNALAKARGASQAARSALDQAASSLGIAAYDAGASLDDTVTRALSGVSDGIGRDVARAVAKRAQETSAARARSVQAQRDRELARERVPHVRRRSQGIELSR